MYLETWQILQLHVYAKLLIYSYFYYAIFASGGNRWITLKYANPEIFWDIARITEFTMDVPVILKT